MSQPARALTQDQIVSRLDELPTLPSIVYELSRVVNDPMASTSDVEKIMANDQSLTIKVLKLVNSAYYAIPGGVSSLSRAIAYIGFDTINQLVLSASILKALESKGPMRFNLNEFWKHSIGVAIASETIAKWIGHPQPSDLFTAGLVHDMGKVALYTLQADQVVAVIECAKEKQISYLDAEIELDVPRHTHVGQALAKKWQLPAGVQSIIRYHHTKEFNQRANLNADMNRNVDIVLLANLLAHALKFGDSGHDRILGAPTDVLERLTIDPKTDVKSVLLEIKSSLDKASDFLRVLGGV